MSSALSTSLWKHSARERGVCVCGGKGGPARLELTCELESADNDVTDGVRVGTGYWREGEVVVQFEGILNNPYGGHQSLRRNTHTHTHSPSHSDSDCSTKLRVSHSL